MGLPPDARLIDELVEERVAQFAVPFASIDPAIVAMVESVKGAGLGVAVVTNVSNLDVAAWYDCELASLISLVVPSYEIGVMKPDPVIYRRALTLLGVEPREAASVGDGGSDELADAAAAGMRPFWATWFLDKWPVGVLPGFDGDEWRRGLGGKCPFPSVESPEELVLVLMG